MSNILLIFAHSFMSLRNVIILLSFIYFYIFRNAIINMAIPVAATFYLITLMFYRMKYNVMGGVISIIAMLCILFILTHKARFYTTHNDFSSDVLNNFDSEDITYDESRHMLVIKREHNKYKGIIQEMYRKTRSSTWKTKLFTIYLWIILIFHILQLYFHLRQVYYSLLPFLKRG